MDYASGKNSLIVMHIRAKLERVASLFIQRTTKKLAYTQFFTYLTVESNFDAIVLTINFLNKMEITIPNPFTIINNIIHLKTLNNID